MTNNYQKPIQEDEDCLTLAKFIDIINLFFSKHNGKNFFRGQPDKSYPIIPSAGRDGVFNKDKPDNDLEMFDNWINILKSKTNFPNSKFEKLLFAQHHGLHTRLLDWTTNPLVALFFACISNEKEINKDGHVICYPIKQTEILNIDDEGVFEKDGIFFNANIMGVSQRVLSQEGFVTIHNPPNVDIRSLNPQDANEIIIPMLHKEKLLSELDRFGINYGSLFPDLEGYTKYCNWAMKNGLS